MLTLLSKLYRTGLLTGPGLLRLLEALVATGVNLMALLRFAANMYSDRVAVTDEQERVTYRELYRLAEALAAALHTEHGVTARQRVALGCRNHVSAVKALFALGRLGAHVYLINPEMSAEQLWALADHYHFDFYVYDESQAALFLDPPLSLKSIPSYHPTGNSIARLAAQPGAPAGRLPRVTSGNLVVMTGGTTGQPKAASRKPSLLDFLPPFAALLTQLHLERYRSLYVATPLYHGFGLAAVVVGVLLGTEMYFLRRFEARQACSLIAQRRIEAVTLVPLMLQRMLAEEGAGLSSLRCIITGGATLSPALARESCVRLGPTLYNLYGTSEAGFCILGTPDLLSRKPESIGRPVPGVRAHIVDASERPLGDMAVGLLRIRSGWSTRRRDWIETGDLAYRDADGDLFLRGRVDDMIVSGGENVYPIELENILLQHPEVESAAVVGVPDAEFGQRLKAVVVLRQGEALDEASLRSWLKSHAARYQMPAVIEFRDTLPYTPLGKPDKNALRG